MHQSAFLRRAFILLPALFLGLGTASAELGDIAGPQPELPKIVLKIGAGQATVEVADELAERTIGLMHRKELAKDHGMLFVFDRPQPLSFWMKNTLVPLSIAFISPEGQILEIKDMQPLSEAPVACAFPNVLYALEMQQGWFQQHKVLPGDRIANLPLPK